MGVVLSDLINYSFDFAADGFDSPHVTPIPAGLPTTDGVCEYSSVPGRRRMEANRGVVVDTTMLPGPTSLPYATLACVEM